MQVAEALGHRRDAEREGQGQGQGPRRDGSFWMTWDDFFKYFKGNVTMCGNRWAGMPIYNRVGGPPACERPADGPPSSLTPILLQPWDMAPAWLQGRTRPHT